MNTKPYSHKLPTIVRNTITGFTNNECLLVKQKLDTKNSKPLNCHYNVSAQVNELGGNILNGWLLTNNTKLKDAGIWYWSFHSVWHSENGDLYDITKDNNNNREFSTFIPDLNRSIDLENGISYNDIVIFETNLATSIFNLQSNSNLEIGNVYWSANSMSSFRANDNYNGQYRLIRSEFKNNIIQMEKDYNVIIVDGKLQSKTGAKEIPQNFIFEYSVGS